MIKKTKSSVPLLPCPWCGGSNLETYLFRDGDQPIDYVQCMDCTSCGPDHVDGKHWNTRAPLQQTSPHEATPEHGLPSDSRSVLVLTSYDQWMVASYLRPGNGVHGWRYDNEDENTRDRIIHWEELPKWPR